MISHYNRFPIFFMYLLVIAFMASCSNSRNTKNSTVSNDNIEKGSKFLDENKLDSAFYYFNAAKLSCNEKESEKILYALTKMCEI
jgi:hypothetical protein